MKFVAYTSILKCSLILNSKTCKFIWKSFHNFINQGLINLCRCCLCLKLDTRQPEVCLLPLALVSSLPVGGTVSRWPGRLLYEVCLCTIISILYDTAEHFSTVFYGWRNFIIWWSLVYVGIISLDSIFQCNFKFSKVHMTSFHSCYIVYNSTLRKREKSFTANNMFYCVTFTMFNTNRVMFLM